MKAKSLKKTQPIMALTLLLSPLLSVSAQQPVSLNHKVNVQVNLDTAHIVEGVESFDRQKYITVHSGLTDPDWLENNSQSRQQENEQENLMDTFLSKYDVYFGRETGGITSNLHSSKQDKNRPGFVDEKSLRKKGNESNEQYAHSKGDKWAAIRKHEFRAADMVVGAQQHPFWPDGKLTKRTGWAISQTDTKQEPLGTATGHYMANYVHHFFDNTPNNGEVNGKAKPKYLEVMNEPLYDLVTAKKKDPAQPYDIFRLHNAVANEVRKLDKDIFIGGYTAAFPDFDSDNFQRWFDRDKLFIDTAGANMDFISIHLYDFPQKSKTERYRKGSNVEATLDMLEHYTALNNLAHNKGFKPSPIIVSEYGAQTHLLNNKPWSAYRDTMKLRGTNSMLMSFMERPQVMLKTIPFIPLKTEWGRKSEKVPYQSRLMMQKFERPGETSKKWVYTDMVKFYELWAEVKGKRVDTWASDLDITVDAYVNGNEAFLILNSLEFTDTPIALNTLGIANNQLKAVNIKHLLATKDKAQASKIVETNAKILPDSITLNAESTMVIKLSYAKPVVMPHKNEEVKYYATDYLQAIKANHTIQFSVNDVRLNSQGEAVLRMGLGRDHGKSLQPTVKVNGMALKVPTDFRGYDQKQGKKWVGRDNYFGVIEIPVPYQALKANNTITIQFNDKGGYVSSLAMQVFNTTKPLIRH